MNLRNVLILLSLAANLGLVVSFNASLSRAGEARQLLIQQGSEINRLRTAGARVKPGVAGLTAAGLATELVLLQRVKTAVATEISRTRGQDFKCARGSAGELGRLLNAMAEFKKRLDALKERSDKEARDRDDMVTKVEQEARKMKEELLQLCSR